ncbi:hypothetical protein GQ42DRAFT_3681 [Ramicandelaber brevisporus]|nr:hypothetical protein GQ42DRAFT_3681 [Ramicandelaber brevisporus]
MSATPSFEGSTLDADVGSAAAEVQSSETSSIAEDSALVFDEIRVLRGHMQRMRERITADMITGKGTRKGTKRVNDGGMNSGGSTTQVMAVSGASSSNNDNSSNNSSSNNSSNNNGSNNSNGSSQLHSSSKSENITPKWRPLPRIPAPLRHAEPSRLPLDPRARINKHQESSRATATDTAATQAKGIGGHSNDTVTGRLVMPSQRKIGNVGSLSSHQSVHEDAVERLERQQTAIDGLQEQINQLREQMVQVQSSRERQQQQQQQHLSKEKLRQVPRPIPPLSPIRRQRHGVYRMVSSTQRTSRDDEAHALLDAAEDMLLGDVICTLGENHISCAESRLQNGKTVRKYTVSLKQPYTITIAAYPDGNIKCTDPCKQTDTLIFNNGDVQISDWYTGATTYTFANSGTMHIDHADGRHEWHFLDGTALIDT